MSDSNPNPHEKLFASFKTIHDGATVIAESWQELRRASVKNLVPNLGILRVTPDTESPDYLKALNAANFATSIYMIAQVGYIDAKLNALELSLIAKDVANESSVPIPEWAANTLGIDTNET